MTTEDPRFNYKSEQFAPKSREVENWRKLRGEYLLAFIRELQSTMYKGRKLYLGLPAADYFVAPFGNLHIDWRTIFEERLADAIVFANYSGRAFTAWNKTPHRQLGYLASHDDNYNVWSRDRVLEKFGDPAKKRNIEIIYRQGYDSQKQNLFINAPVVRNALFLDDTPALRPKEFTVEGFFNLASNQGLLQAEVKTPRLISKYGHASPDNRGWELYLDESGKLAFRVNTRDQNGKQIDYTIKSEEKMPRDRWVHLAGVFDAPKKELRLYLDGREVGRRDLPPGSTLNANPAISAVVGAYAGTGTMEAMMQVDELRISNVARHFSAIPAAPYSGREPGTLALWHFEREDGEPDFVAPGIRTRLVGRIKQSEGHFGRAFDLREETDEP